MQLPSLYQNGKIFVYMCDVRFFLSFLMMSSQKPVLNLVNVVFIGCIQGDEHIRN